MVDKIECTKCHTELLRTSEWRCPQCQVTRQQLQSEVTAWHEYAMSRGCSHHDNLWYDPEGNSIIETVPRMASEVEKLNAEIEKLKRYWTHPREVFDENKRLDAEVKRLRDALAEIGVDTSTDPVERANRALEGE